MAFAMHTWTTALCWRSSANGELDANIVAVTYGRIRFGAYKRVHVDGRPEFATPRNRANPALIWDPAPGPR